MVLLGQPNYAAIAATILGLPQTVTTMRALRELDQATAAAQIGIGKTTLANLEAGTSSPTQPTIVSVLRWLSPKES